MRFSWRIVIGVVLLISVIGGMYAYVSWIGTLQKPTDLGVVVLVGLALVVVLMAGLAIVYSSLGLTNQAQALGLPEGSVRALIAFSLVLVFVCLATFLHGAMNSAEPGPGNKALSRITEDQLNELKGQFIVAYEQVRNADGTPANGADGKPLYNASYFSRHNKDADDFAKQIFTTLATVFVSVISFYFGSSATTAGVGAGAKAREETKRTDDVQGALTDAQSAAHDAQTSADAVTAAAKNAETIVTSATAEKQEAARAQLPALQKAQEATAQAARDARQQVEIVRRAVADASAAGSENAKITAATADATRARDAARQFAETAKTGAAEADQLLNKIKTIVA